MLIADGESFIECNRASWHMFGAATREDLLGRRPCDMSPPTQPDGRDSHEAGEEKIAEALAKGQVRFDWRYQRLDGTEFDADVQLSLLEGQGGSVIQGIIRDVTERRRAEAALQESEQRFRAIFDHAADGILLADPQTMMFAMGNPRISEMLRYSLDEIQTLGVSDVHPPESLPHVRAEFERQARGEKTLAEDIPVLRKDGSVFSADVSAAHITLNGRPYLLGSFRDITERKQARARLVTAREQERRRLAGELHDSIGQSLVALQLTVQNAAATVRDRLDAEQTAALIGATAQCTELIRDVRHICHGLYPPILESLGLIAGMRQLAQDVERTGIVATVKCSKAIEARRFSNDIEIALFRIAQEAITNAIRHGECTEIGIALRRKRDRIHLTVEDNGVGFAPDRTVGNGLGLTHMRERAQAAGGTVSIRSKKGRTRVEAVLPDRPPGDDNGDSPLAGDPSSE